MLVAVLVASVWSTMLIIVEAPSVTAVDTDLGLDQERQL